MLKTSRMKMFNKAGMPFFIIMIPFTCLLFSSFFSTSYYLKVSNEELAFNLKEYKQLITNDNKKLNKILTIKKEKHLEKQKEFIDFMIIITLCLFIFLSLFTILMSSIINDIIKKYIKKVEIKENSLEDLNKNLLSKVSLGIEEGKRKDKAILQQNKLASLGSMINMIAHQWRQPLSELSGVLMELELATKFKKADDEHIFKAIEKSDKMIDFMSNTIEDFRNFYKPNKKKEEFYLSTAYENALVLVNASLKNLDIKLNLKVLNDKKINGYAREYSQVILNIISNAKDILIEREIINPVISISIDSHNEVSTFVIKDNAKGIKKEHFDRIFDPYFSTKSSSKGTGLGLYISKLIIEKNMNGKLTVQNDEEGAVFVIKV